MNQYLFHNPKTDVKRTVRARTEAGARGRLPKGPGWAWVLLDVIKPPPMKFDEDEQLEVPLTWGQGGPVIGTATVYKNGMTDIRISEDGLRVPGVKKATQADVKDLSIGFTSPEGDS